MTVHPFPRRPLADSQGVITHNFATGKQRLIVRCEPPTHLFASGVPGAVCQCGDEHWLADHQTVVHTVERGGVNVTTSLGVGT